MAARYNYALIEGAGGAPSVFASPANQSAHNIFDVSLPIEDELIPFVDWVASLPPGQRPKTAAYPMANDPFADPPVQLAQQRLKALGVKTVYSKIFPAENASYKPAADQVAATGAQAVVLGSTDVPTVSAFMQAFEQQHYNPKMFICAAGPDQGAAFTSAVGKSNATGDRRVCDERDVGIGRHVDQKDMTDLAPSAEPSVFGDDRVHHDVGVQAAFHEAVHLTVVHEVDGRSGRFLFAGGVDNLAAAEISPRLCGHRADPQLQPDEHRRDDLFPPGIHGDP